MAPKEKNTGWRKRKPETKEEDWLSEFEFDKEKDKDKMPWLPPPKKRDRGRPKKERVPSPVPDVFGKKDPYEKERKKRAEEERAKTPDGFWDMDI